MKRKCSRNFNPIYQQQANDENEKKKKNKRTCKPNGQTGLVG